MTITITEALYAKAGRMIDSAAMLTADEYDAAESVIGAWMRRDKVSERAAAIVEACRHATPSQPRAKASKLDWLVVKSEARRLGYTVPEGGLSNAKRGQIVKELRAMGAAI